MNTVDYAHAVLEQTRRIYDRTGWCRRSLVLRGGPNGTSLVSAEQRCLTGALSLAIITVLPLHVTPERFMDLGDEYPAQVFDFLDPENRAVVALAMDRLIDVLTDGSWFWGFTANKTTFLYELEHYRLHHELGDRYRAVQSAEHTIIAWNDDSGRTRDDILVALEKATANT
jgi:hypothetical protein